MADCAPCRALQQSLEEQRREFLALAPSLAAHARLVPEQKAPKRRGWVLASTFALAASALLVAGPTSAQARSQCTFTPKAPSHVSVGRAVQGFRIPLQISGGSKCGSNFDASTTLVRGVPSLSNPHTICVAGEKLSSEKCRILKLLGVQMAVSMLRGI